MLNRRHLRVKVLQALYAWYQSENKEIKPHEKALLQSVDRVYEMYITMLSFLAEVAEYTARDAEERGNKYLPSAEDLNPNMKLLGNKFIALLTINPEYTAGVKKYSVSWAFDPELAKSVFNTLKTSKEYQDYLVNDDESITAEKEIIKYVFRKIVLKSPAILQVFEERFINWQVDKDVVQGMITKTFKNFSDEEDASNKLAQISANWREDEEFVIDLFRYTINKDDEYQEMITERTKNWEADRIAMMDTILMKMALCELMHFPSIPVKVTINEYLEISKEYSTPKSNSFINGILDKILSDLKKDNKLRKSGRGLID